MATGRHGSWSVGRATCRRPPPCLSCCHGPSGGMQQYNKQDHTHTGGTLEATAAWFLSKLPGWVYCIYRPAWVSAYIQCGFKLWMQSAPTFPPAHRDSHSRPLMCLAAIVCIVALHFAKGTVPWSSLYTPLPQSPSRARGP